MRLDSRKLDVWVMSEELQKMKGFKLVIAGGRDIPVKKVKRIIKFNWKNIMSTFKIKKPKIIITGCADGVDKAARKMAKKLTGKRACVFAAEWERYGKSAGPRRNELMAQEGDGLLLIWNGKSRGSASMLSKMQAHNKPIMEIMVDSDLP